MVWALIVIVTFLWFWGAAFVSSSFLDGRSLKTAIRERVAAFVLFGVAAYIVLEGIKFAS